MFEEIVDKHLDSNPQTMHILMLRATSASYQKDDRQFKIKNARGILQITAHQQNKNSKTNDTSGSLQMLWHWEIFSNCKCIVMVLSLQPMSHNQAEANCIKTKVWRRQNEVLKKEDLENVFHLEANCPTQSFKLHRIFKSRFELHSRKGTLEKWLPYSKCISWLRRQQPSKELWMFAKWK